MQSERSRRANRTSMSLRSAPERSRTRTKPARIFYPSEKGEAYPPTLVHDPRPTPRPSASGRKEAPMTRMTRRQLRGPAAMAAVAAGVAGRTTLAQGSAHKAAIDQALRQAAEARQVPGVVAVAATD